MRSWRAARKSHAGATSGREESSKVIRCSDGGKGGLSA